MAGYIGTKAVNLSTTGADIAGDADVSGALDVGGTFTSQGIDDNATSTAMTLDASGNVGIGTSSPNKPLTVFTSAATDSARFTDNTNSELFIKHSAGNLLTLATGSTSQPMAFGQGSTERMRIDSSGNLLVGTTSTATNDVGFKVFQSTGQTVTTASGTNPVLFNRKTSDGDIAIFRKDDVTVGSIGNTGGNLYIQGSTATGKMGLEFGGSALYARDNGTATNGSNDLGDAAYRWKDLYLSGGVYLGGTGAANKLDDYEEGTWTPIVSSGSVTVTKATYTKIGNLVMVQADVTLGGTRGTESFAIDGLPFANGTSRWTAFSMYHGASIGTHQQVSGVFNQGNSTATFNRMGGNVLGNEFSNTYLNIGGTYLTN